MNSHPRIRKRVKWGGAVVTVLLVVLWTGSGFCEVGYESTDGTKVALTFGCLYISVEPGWQMWDHLGWNIRYHPSGWLWAPQFDRNGYGPFMYFPLWVPWASTLMLTLLAWRQDALARRRARTGFCSKCNYNRTGLAASAVCPECGSTPPQSSN